MLIKSASSNSDSHRWLFFLNTIQCFLLFTYSMQLLPFQISQTRKTEIHLWMCVMCIRLDYNDSDIYMFFLCSFLHNFLSFSHCPPFTSVSNVCSLSMTIKQLISGDVCLCILEFFCVVISISRSLLVELGVTHNRCIL